MIFEYDEDIELEDSDGEMVAHPPADHAVWLTVDCKVCGETLTSRELPYPLLHRFVDRINLECDECNETAEYERSDYTVGVSAEVMPDSYHERQDSDDDD